MPNLKALAAVSAVILGAAAVARGEQYTLETYYPAPLGVYKAIKADFQDFYNYTGAVTAAGAPPSAAPPPAGRLFYNRELNGFYFSSSEADPSDTSTWYKAVSGLDQETVGLGSKGAFTPPGSGAVWIPSLSATVGSVAGSTNQMLRSPKRYSSPGLATVGFSGTFCVGPASVYAKPTVVEGTGPNPEFFLYYRRFSCPTAACASISAWSDWISLGSSNETLTLDASGCGAFEMEAVVLSSALRGLAMGIKIKRDAAGDRVENVTLQMKRVLSF
jgi:hypothetical protein